MGAPPGLFDVDVDPDLTATAHQDLNDYMATVGLVFMEDNPTVVIGLCEAFFEPEFNNDKGDYATNLIAANAESTFSFRIPADYKSLAKLVLVGIPNNTDADGPFDLDSQYGKVGEQFDTHSESDLTGTVSTTAGQKFELDISSVFSSIEAGDSCGLLLNQNGVGGGVHYLGILLQYSNVQ